MKLTKQSSIARRNIINPDYELLSKFSYSSRYSFLKTALLRLYLIPRLIFYVNSLERIELTFDKSLISHLIQRHLNKRIAGFKIHSYAQAHLNIENGLTEWMEHSSRRNLRKNLRKAEERQLELRIINFSEIRTDIEKMEIDRGGNLRGFWGNFPNGVPENELICAAVYSTEKILMAVCIGSNTRFTAKIFAAISNSRGDGARWLAFFGIIQHYYLSDVQNILVSDRIGLSKGNLEFQHYFGMKSVNLKIKFYP